MGEESNEEESELEFESSDDNNIEQLIEGGLSNVEEANKETKE